MNKYSFECPQHYFSNAYNTRDRKSSLRYLQCNDSQGTSSMSKQWLRKQSKNYKHR